MIVKKMQMSQNGFDCLRKGNVPPRVSGTQSLKLLKRCQILHNTNCFDFGFVLPAVYTQNINPE